MGTPELAITLDIDWAPDFVIDFVADILAQHGATATWFVTHSSPAVRRLQQVPALFELGIHPNFFAGSSHGRTLEDILQYCMSLVPDARAVRTHGLFWSAQIQHLLFTRTGILTDLSLILPHAPALRPIPYNIYGRTLWRLPYYWEDDFEMLGPNPCWSADALTASVGGLKIINFHPMHIYLNSADYKAYERVKKIRPDLIGLAPDDLNEVIHSGSGVQTLFRQIAGLVGAGGAPMRVEDIRLRAIPTAMTV